MNRIARAQLAKLSPGQRLKLWNSLTAFREATGGTLKVGSGCSGTDVLCHAVDILCDVLTSAMGVQVGWSHEFAAEKVEFKRRFLAEHWTPRILLADIAELASATGFDTVSMKPAAISRAILAAFGIECDSISGLNCNAKNNRGCVASGNDKTGLRATMCLWSLITCC
jgi:hypothetical protein